MIDGVYNNRRKLYILTTNRLSVDENLLGRPGRIRYIKEFGNLSSKAINDVIDDNLEDVSLKEDILKLVDTLEISTIDILKSIIDEYNIMGEVPADPMLNIPKAKYKMRIISFDDLDSSVHQEVKDFIKSQVGFYENVEDWFTKIVDKNNESKPKRNKDIIEEKYGCDIDIQTCSSASPCLYLDQHINHGTVTSEPDEKGFFMLDTDWSGTTLCCLGNKCGNPSLYRGGH